MQARKIIRQASLVCWVLGIPFDHPRFNRLACQLAKARMTRISSKTSDLMHDELESLCEQEYPDEWYIQNIDKMQASKVEFENAI